MLQLLYFNTPGMHVRVVKSLSFTSDEVLVKAFNIVLFPTEGKPIKATRASPCFITSNPSFVGPVFFGGVYSIFYEIAFENIKITFKYQAICNFYIFCC